MATLSFYLFLSSAVLCGSTSTDNSSAFTFNCVNRKYAVGILVKKNVHPSVIPESFIVTIPHSCSFACDHTFENRKYVVRMPSIENGSIGPNDAFMELPQAMSTGNLEVVTIKKGKSNCKRDPAEFLVSILCLIEVRNALANTSLTEAISLLSWF